jgi:hypothetical protein
MILIFVKDLKMITERLKLRYYSHVHLFRADVMRLFTNCRDVFTPDTEQHKCANQLQAYFEKKLNESELGSTTANTTISS